MAIIKLTDTQWLEQESEKVEGVLRQWLGGSEGKEGRDSDKLRKRLKYAGLEYTPADLAAIRDKLIADGVIEVV